MSKATLGVLFTAIALVIMGTYLDLPAFSGGTGVLLVAALVYAFHVAKREVTLLSYSIEEREAERNRKNAAPPRVPQEARGASKHAI